MRVFFFEFVNLLKAAREVHWLFRIKPLAHIAKYIYAAGRGINMLILFFSKGIAIIIPVVRAIGNSFFKIPVLLFFFKETG